MARLILDSGAVIALASGNVRARQVVARAIQERTLVVTPAVVVAETTRGGPRDALVNRVLEIVHDITPVTEATAREASRLLGPVGAGTVTVDALIVAKAAARDATAILTGDVQDISLLAAGYPHVRVYGV